MIENQPILRLVQFLVCRLYWMSQVTWRHWKLEEDLGLTHGREKLPHQRSSSVLLQHLLMWSKLLTCFHYSNLLACSRRHAHLSSEGLKRTIKVVLVQTTFVTYGLVLELLKFTKQLAARVTFL